MPIPTTVGAQPSGANAGLPAPGSEARPSCLTLLRFGTLPNQEPIRSRSGPARPDADANSWVVALEKGNERRRRSRSGAGRVAASYSKDVRGGVALTRVIPQWAGSPCKRPYDQVDITAMSIEALASQRWSDASRACRSPAVAYRDWMSGPVGASRPVVGRMFAGNAREPARSGQLSP